ncbi:MAG: hypothetical protein KGS45_11855 [Planctomycetes bacterium]|nr:hypothetical protein [Planctomycetota bacterium]
MLIAVPILTILTLVGLLVFWGVSLIWRGLSRAKDIEGRRSCPACDEDMRGLTSLTCPTCKNCASTEADLRTRKPIRPAIVGGMISITLGLVILLGSSFLLSWLFESDSYALRISTLASIGIMLIATALVTRGLYGDRARGRRRCPACWYPIRTSHLTCPECGHTVTSESHFFRTRRGGKLILLGIAAVLLASLPPLFSGFKRGGPVGFVPTPILILGMRHVPDEWLVGGSPNADEDLSLHERLLEDSFVPDLQHWYQRHTSLRAFDLYMSDLSRPKIYRELVGYANHITTQREIILRILESLESPTTAVSLRAAEATNELQINDWIAAEWIPDPTHELAITSPVLEINAFDQRIAALLSHSEPQVHDAALDLSYLKRQPIPPVAQRFIARALAGQPISSSGWTAIAVHGKQTISEQKLVELLRVADPWPAISFLLEQSRERLESPAVLAVLMPQLEHGPSRSARAIGAAYAFRRAAPDRVIPLLTARLADPDLDSHRFLFTITRFRAKAPEAITFILIALNDPRDRFRAAACEALDRYTTTFPEYLSLSKSLLATRVTDPSPEVRKAARWCYQQALERLRRPILSPVDADSDE